MKTSIKSLIALAITAVVLTSSSVSANATESKKVTVLSQVKKVSKINVSGNVELILVQSADESVKVYNDYYASNALVQQKDGELRISSFNKETLTVIVYVTNLSKITAADNATVKTYGKFNVLSLDVTLKDQATAVLNTNTISLSTDLGGRSALTLTGTTDEYNAVMGSVAKVNMDQFAAQSTNIQSKNGVIARVASTVELPSADDLFNL